MYNLQNDIESLKSQLKSGEKYAIINKITKSAKQKLYKDEEIQTFLKSDIIKADKFNQILYANIANNLQSNELFIKLLKTENDQIISDTIRKFNYFYSQEIHTPEYYSNEIFPIISYSHRLLLIKVLADNFETDKAELFFNELYKIYGLKLAKPILKKCSKKFILEKLNNPGIVLQNFELKSFLTTDAKFVLEYLTNLLTAFKDKKPMIIKTDLSKYKYFFKELLICYPREVIELLNNCSDFGEHKFGKKITKRSLQNAKDIIIKNSTYFSNILTTSIIFKVLTKEEYIEFIKDFYPEKVDNFDYEIPQKLNEYLDLCKTTEDKLNLLLISYKSVYGKEWLDNPKNLSPSIMKFLDKERRLKFVNDKIRNKDDKYIKLEEWKCYLDCESCIPIFKEQIKISSDSQIRKKYMKYIIQSCIINDDMKALLVFLKYFNERHRNEMSEIRLSIINYMSTNLNLKSLTEDIWNEIYLILDVIDLNDEFNKLYYAKQLIVGAVEYAMKKKKILDKAIKNLIKYTRHNCYYDEWNIFKNKEYEKTLIQLIGKLIPETFIDKTDIECCSKSYYARLHKWNKENPNDILSAVNYPWLIDEITKVFDAEDDYKKRIYIDLIIKDVSANEYFTKQISDLQFQFRIETLSNLAKINPERIKSCIGDICENIDTLYNCQHYIIPVIKSGILKNIEGVEEGIRNYCWDIMKSDVEENWSKKTCTFRVLKYWLTSEEFFKIAEENLPKSSVAPTGNPIAKHIFELQASIVYELKNYKNHPDVFNYLRKFCIGDYLKLSIGSLNSLCMKSPFKKSSSFLNSCIDTPVSFQKHVIRLKCLLDKRNVNLEFLKKLWINAKNPSIRQVILEIIFNLFITSPDSQLWTLVKVSIESLNNKDISTLDTIFKFDEIPVEYLSDFIQLCWLLIVKMEKESDLIEKKLTILNVINDKIIIISSEFIDSILNDIIFEHDINNVLQFAYIALAVNYIYHGNDNTIILKRIDNILNKLKIAYETNWNNLTDNDTINFGTRTNINHFLMEITKISITKKDKFQNVSNFILINLHKKLLSLIPNAPTVLYFGQLQLQIIQIYLKSTDFLEMGKNLRNLLDNEILEKGDYIIQLFKIILDDVLAKDNDVKLNEIANGLLTEPIQSTGCALLAMLLLTSDIHKKENENIKINLMKIKSPIIEILLNTI